MISTLNRLPFAPIAGHQTAVRPADDDGSPPITDELDLSNIDTAGKAAQMPQLDPGIQLMVGYAALLALGENNVQLALTVASETGSYTGEDVEMMSSLTVDAAGGRGVGTVDGLLSQQSIGFAPDGMTWTSSFGSNQTDLTMTVLESGDGLRIEGHIGEVEADLEMRARANDDGINGFLTIGELGGERYLVDSMITQDDEGQSLLVSRGHLAGSPIQRTYDLNLDVEQTRAALTVSGGGPSGGPFAQHSMMMLDITFNEEFV